MRLRMASLFLPPIENILRRARQGFDMPRAKPDFWRAGWKFGKRRAAAGFGSEVMGRMPSECWAALWERAFSRPRAIFLAEENAL